MVVKAFMPITFMVHNYCPIIIPTYDFENYLCNKFVMPGH